jgi:hypothetical protein
MGPQELSGGNFATQVNLYRSYVYVSISGLVRPINFHSMEHHPRQP